MRPLLHLCLLLRLLRMVLTAMLLLRHLILDRRRRRPLKLPLLLQLWCWLLQLMRSRMLLHLPVSLPSLMHRMLVLLLRWCCHLVLHLRYMAQLLLLLLLCPNSLLLLSLHCALLCSLCSG